MTNSQANQRVLFLSLHTFSLVGGIEKVNRSIAKVLADLKQESKISDYRLLSMHDGEADERYLDKEKFEGFGGRKFAFALACLLNKFNVVIVSHINLLVFALLLKKIRPKTHIILMAHGIEVWRPLAKWKITFLKKCQIWAVSNFTATKLEEVHQLQASQIHILNNCLDPFFEIPKEFNKPKALLKKYHFSAEQPILFTLSRLSSAEKYKGYDLVVKNLQAVLKTNPNAHYILAGKADPMEEQRLKELISAHQLERNVTLTGYLEVEEVMAHYQLADVFVMPSTGEGFGISFIEATACGCPVIAGNQDGSTDALLNGELGLLVNPESPEELIHAIEKTLSTAKTIERCIALQQQCLENFSYEQYKKKVIQLLNKVETQPKN